MRVYGASGFRSVPAYGSGVVVHERGFVLTAWSIALRTDTLRIVDHKGQGYQAEVWRADPGLGVALLKVRSTGAAGFTALRLGDSSQLREGSPLLALGNPFGFLYGDEKAAASRGVVTAITAPGRGGFRLIRFPDRLERLVLTDIPNNPGTQGGPLLTLEGELVGIQGRLIESRATNTILNFGVLAESMREFVRKGTAAPEAQPDAPPPTPAARRKPRSLGLRLLRAHLVRSPLAYVERIAQGSTAARAGFKVDDMIFRVGERTIRSCRDFDEASARLVPGNTVEIVVKRGQVMVALSVVVPKEPE